MKHLLSDIGHQGEEICSCCEKENAQEVYILSEGSFRSQAKLSGPGESRDRDCTQGKR